MFCAVVGPTYADEAGPDEAVTAALADLADSIESRRRELLNDAEATHAIVGDFLASYADIRLACGLILDAQWKTATAEQRNRFELAFTQHVMNLLDGLVLDLDFENIAVNRFEGNVDELPVTVRATFRTLDGDLLRFDFRMHDRHGDWRIFDVIAEGVSYVKLYRSEFRQEIIRYGLDETITRFARRSVPK